MIKLALKFLFAASLPFQAFSFGPMLSPSTTSWSSTTLSSHPNDVSQDNHSSMSRRTAFAKSAVAIAGGMNLVFGSTSFSKPAFAAVSEETPRVTTRMGGLLVSVQFVSTLL